MSVWVQLFDGTKLYHTRNGIFYFFIFFSVKKQKTNVKEENMAEFFSCFFGCWTGRVELAPAY
jgi:lysophospholipid acyltransferase (LPLAT)-like uncharacterized protein